MTLYGVELSLIKRALSSFLNDSELMEVLDVDNIAAYGISMGGEAGFYLAAIDPRIKVIVVSQWVENRDLKLAGNLPNSNWKFPNGVYVYNKGFSLKFSDSDILEKLILPRSLFLEAGFKDGQRATSALSKFKMWIQRYPEFYRKRVICAEFNGGGHEIILNNSLKFLLDNLTNRSDDIFECFEVNSLFN